MKKNLVYTIAVIILALATLCTGILLIITNIGDNVVSIGDVKGLTGDVVEVPVLIKKNPGLWGGQVIIDYDSENLSFVSIANGTVFNECEANDTGDSVALLVTQSKLENTRKNGVICTLKFKIKVSADEGKLNLKFNEETNFCNKDEKIVKPVLKNGTITAK